ncbi:hypothetical protein PGJ_00012180 [Porphyromonas gingivalis AJW4]|nr:hypothetical protein PGJ_00012180 [Porphyromonas gingivalis AJW4]
MIPIKCGARKFHFWSPLKIIDNPSFFQRSLYRFTRRRSIVFFPAGKSFPDSRQK